MRHARDEFADRRKLLALDQLRLRAFERLDGLFELGARLLEIAGHLVEHRRQFTALIPGADLHAPGEIAAPDGLRAVAQFTERFGHLAHEKPNHRRTGQDGDQAERQQQKPRRIKCQQLAFVRAE